MAGLLPDTAAYTMEPAAPSRTWKIDWDNCRLDGTADGTEAFKQAALLALLTPRFRHTIYSFNYGSELESLIGKDRNYAAAAAPSMAEEALSVDNRFSQVKSGEFRGEGDYVIGSVSFQAGGSAVQVEAAIGGNT